MCEALSPVMCVCVSCIQCWMGSRVYTYNIPGGYKAGSAILMKAASRFIQRWNTFLVIVESGCLFPNPLTVLFCKFQPMLLISKG